MLSRLALAAACIVGLIVTVAALGARARDAEREQWTSSAASSAAHHDPALSAPITDEHRLRLLVSEPGDPDRIARAAAADGLTASVAERFGVTTLDVAQVTVSNWRRLKEYGIRQDSIEVLSELQAARGAGVAALRAEIERLTPTR